MILHTINAAPSSAAFKDCLRLADAGDAILLLGDAVYAARERGAIREQLQSCGAALYLLGEHAAAAGVDPGDDIAVVDMDGFVALTEHFPRQQAWF